MTDDEQERQRNVLTQSSDAAMQPTELHTGIVNPQADPSQEQVALAQEQMVESARALEATATTLTEEDLLDVDEG